MVTNISSIIQRNRKHKLAAAKLQLERCVSELEYIYKHTDTMFYVFDIPRCLFAVPYYDPDYTIDLISYYLQKQGYDIFRQNYRILINWDPKVSIKSIVTEQEIQRQQLIQHEHKQQQAKNQHTRHAQAQVEQIEERTQYPQPSFEFFAVLANKNS